MDELTIKRKPGRKAIFEKLMTGGEKEARRKAKIAASLQEAIEETRRARKAMELLASESSRMLETMPASTEGQVIYLATSQAFLEASKMMRSLEACLGLKGKLAGVHLP